MSLSERDNIMNDPAARRLPILPPVDIEVDAMPSLSPAVVSSGINQGHEPESEPAHHPPIEVIEWTLASHCESQDDDELSLYIGADRLYLSGVKIPSYNDLSNITSDEMAPAITDFDVKLSFAVRLHSLLSEHCDAVDWLWHGRAFVIVNQAKLCDELLRPAFGFGYGTFLDNLYFYGFHRVLYAYECNGRREVFEAFYHEVRLVAAHLYFLSAPQLLSR